MSRTVLLPVPLEDAPCVVSALQCGADHCWPDGSSEDEAKLHELADTLASYIAIPPGPGLSRDAYETLEAICDEPSENGLVELPVESLRALLNAIPKPEPFSHPRAAFAQPSVQPTASENASDRMQQLMRSQAPQAGRG